MLVNKDQGIVYAFVGVIGSGKSYRAEELCKKSTVEKRPVIMGDFSEGIRQTLVKILSGEDREINVNSEAYSSWKRMPQTINLPIHPLRDIPYVLSTNGRELLQRTGEFLKQLAGDDVWANWTGKQVTKKWVDLPEGEAYRANIVFGSVRFLEEAETVFTVANMMSKQVKFIFCDYKSDKYELNNHVSEALARRFVEKGFQDGDDITNQILCMLR